MRKKYTVYLPQISNDKISDLLVEKCKGLEVSWISDKEAVISSENTLEEMKKIFNDLHIKLSKKTYTLKHNIKNDKEAKHEVITKWG